MGSCVGTQLAVRDLENCSTWCGFDALFLWKTPYTLWLDKSKVEHHPRPCCRWFYFELCSFTHPPFLVKVFDLLYLNGMSLHKKSLKFRKRNLRACIQPVPGRMEFVVEFEGKTAKDVRQRMDEVMEARGEGLILKHPDSEYTLNGRNKDWIKVKPEYMVCPLSRLLYLAHSCSHRMT